MKLKRIYHPVSKWEECNFNMWGEVPGLHDEALQMAIEFTGDAEHYGEYMLRVAKEWPISCENALTDYHLNRRAWIGHAACALFARIPEHITREAWRYLTYEQQLLANQKANDAIASWEQHYRQDQQIRVVVGETMLLEWHPR